MKSNNYIGFLYPAYNDIHAIESLVQNIDEHAEVICFHAQQAAEKILKNVFERNGKIPKQTHSLRELLSQAIDEGWLEASFDEVRMASHLQQYAVAVRYSDTPDIQVADALQSIVECNKLSDMIERSGYETIKINVPATFLRDIEIAEKTTEPSKNISTKKQVRTVEATCANARKRAAEQTKNDSTNLKSSGPKR